jgi:RND family efflux transporter MFP subunit
MPPRRRWLTRTALPVLVLLLSGGLLAYAARDAFRPAVPVRAVRVVATESAGRGGPTPEPGAAAMSVLAPGWVEPDPYPIYVTALTSGIIERVLVLEGQPVTAGQVIAEMVDEDARLATARASAELGRREARLRAAQTDWEHPIALQRAVAVNEALRAEAKAELARVDAVVVQKKAKLRESQAAYDRLSRLLPKAVAELQVEQARYQVDAQRALVDASEKQQPVIEARISRYEAEVKAAKDDLRLRVAARMALDEAEASVKEGQAALDVANLRLARMKIVTPVAGIVMQRLVAPGAKLMLDMGDHHSAHVIHVYDPERLQVRVDVPLGDAAKVGVGQHAQVVVDVLPNRHFTGRVTRIVHQADIGKNTVEVKVEIEDPSPLLKPDMLARVKFFAALPAGATASAAFSALTVYAPRRAVKGAADQAHVWMITAGESRLRRQTVKLGAARADGWIAVTEGLQPGDVLVDEPGPNLQEGQRVAVIEVDDQDD